MKLHELLLGALFTILDHAQAILAVVVFAACIIASMYGIANYQSAIEQHNRTVAEVLR